MRMMGLNEIREAYLKFFEEKGHLRAESAPLVPQSDASLLLINSGMAPLKPYFSGEVTPPAKRMTSCQKCIRTPDIENVGKTSRHGTFFEMLGNFSFGDYFKKEAIAWAWEFCTQTVGLPVERLYPSVYLEDDEAWDIWTKDIGVSEDHMVRLGKKDNFWEIGSGPCGPCSEIYYDRGEASGCGDPGCAPGCDCDRYVEFWNLVFTQFNNDGCGNYTLLAQKNIDTGMGLERLACILQGVDNLFEVDTIRRVLQRVCEIAGVTYKANERQDVSVRVITDHIRSTTMLISDGVLPSNEGRGYVLRRLLRRAARHGRLLGVKEPFLHDLCTTVVEESGSAYPALMAKKDFICRVVRLEEERFGQTVEAGLRLFGEAMAKTMSVFSGETAFKLYDTFGFPIDLTLELLEEQNVELDRAEFDALMQMQRSRAREARAALGDFGWQSLNLALDRDLQTTFTGYEQMSSTGTIWAIHDNTASVKLIEEGQEAVLVLDATPFYAESGGQVADTGVIFSDTGSFAVKDVQKSKDGKILHIGFVETGVFEQGDSVTAQVDAERRRAIMRAHSAAHLLQKALRDTLGGHIEQAGSLVEPDRVRFDFTHFSALSSEELETVGREVNDHVLMGLPVLVREMPLDKAREEGAVALFGEKYGSVVRTVKMGDYSFELCGGTHLDNTAKVGSFWLLGESSVAAGVRRIEARVGKAVLEHAQYQARMLQMAAVALKATPNDLVERAERVIDELRGMQRTISGFMQRQSNEIAERLLFSSRTIEGLKVVTAARDDLEPEQMRTMAVAMAERAPELVGVVATTQGDKITFLAVCGKDAIARGIKAGELIREVTKICGGSGGGKPDLAMGGGKDAMLVDNALATVDDFILSRVK